MMGKLVTLRDKINTKHITPEVFILCSALPCSLVIFYMIFYFLTLKNSFSPARVISAGQATVNVRPRLEIKPSYMSRLRMHEDKSTH